MILAEWKAAYPQAKLFASPGLRRRRRDLTFDADLIDAADPAWAGDVDQVLFKGSFAMAEAVFLRRASGTAIFADLIQSLPRDLVKGWHGVFARLGGIVEQNPGDFGRLAGWLSSRHAGAKRTGGQKAGRVTCHIIQIRDLS